LESTGGAGSKLQQKETVQVPTVIQVHYPKNAVQCILSANSQLSHGGRVRVELFNGGRPAIAPAKGSSGATSASSEAAAAGTETVAGSVGAASFCRAESVDLGDLGTWLLTGSGVSCTTARSVFNRYEHASLRADGTTQPLGAWKCRVTRFVAFKADTDDGYEAWRCWQGSKRVTFATGNPDLAGSPGSVPSTSAPAGFSTSGGGASGTVSAGSYSGVAKVGAWGPIPQQTICPHGGTVNEGSPRSPRACPHSLLRRNLRRRREQWNHHRTADRALVREFRTGYASGHCIAAR
jgi:hypothetical protein